ncbi:uncharacterized protein C8R40DRAFT_1073968 [Lentinula edodes]|uniref:uncharacterized protein n=1 Tax=Lentinula edodes TaxID=5353 RepID=UPI001E8CD5E6|nr:uncharacterized protein C8R40DRAFT_1073968 [Lentinula edodes]KAH7869660.1 hypothetical protein C8R40DRAFT_1073968 [Lentinula edodes]
MYLFFTAMLVNVLVFAAPPPKAPTPPSRRVGTTGPFLSNNIGFAPDQQFVLFVGDRHTFQYHHDTGKISAEIDVVDFKTFGSSPPFIKLGTDYEQDIFINFGERETMTVKRANDTIPIYGLPGFWGLIQDVEDLRTTTGIRFNSDTGYVDAVFVALLELVRADGKTKLLELEDYQRWQKIHTLNWNLRGGVERMLGAWDDQSRHRQ